MGWESSGVVGFGLGKNSSAQKLRMIFYLLFTLLVLVWELKIFKIFMHTVKL